MRLRSSLIDVVVGMSGKVTPPSTSAEGDRTFRLIVVGVSSAMLIVSYGRPQWRCRRGGGRTADVVVFVYVAFTARNQHLGS